VLGASGVVGRWGWIEASAGCLIELVGAAIKPGSLHCASRRVRSEANAEEKASARFGRDDNVFLFWRLMERWVVEVTRRVVHGAVGGGDGKNRTLLKAGGCGTLAGCVPIV
jgi:hypothetical protein